MHFPHLIRSACSNQTRLEKAWFCKRSALHLVSLIGGLEFPTSSIEYGPDGRPLPLEFQAGTGSWDPIVGASYTMFMDPWSLFVSSIATCIDSVTVSALGGDGLPGFGDADRQLAR